MFERVDDEGRGHGARRLPADEAPGVDVDDESDVDDPRPGRAVGEVRDPQLIGPGGGEVALHQIRCPRCAGSALVVKRFFARLAPRMPCARISRATWSRPASMPARRPPSRACAARRPSSCAPRAPSAAGPDGVTHRPGRRRPGLGVVVGGGGDCELLADRLDPPSQPTGMWSRWASMKATISCVGGRAPPRRKLLPPGGCRWPAGALCSPCAA